MTKILLAINSFKGSNFSFEVNHALKTGLQKHIASDLITIFPMCDGGDGSIEALHYHCKWPKVKVNTVDALGRPLFASYLWDVHQHSAYIELSKASGLAKLEPRQNNILKANTIGTGTLIKKAILKGAKKIVLLIGGSATNDAGIGILHTLGVKFLSKSGKLLDPLPSNITSIKTIDASSCTVYGNINFEIWTDVTNPFTGPSGAVAIYGPQKGATGKDQIILERNMIHFQNLILDKYSIHLDRIKGTGAAGGIAAGLHPILGATIHQGTQEIFSLTKFEHQIKIHDLIITGEGRLDNQSAYGKLIDGVIKIAHAHHKPVVGVCGSMSLTAKEINSIGFKSVFTIVQGPISLEESMNSTLPFLHHLGFRLGGFIKALTD